MDWVSREIAGVLATSDSQVTVVDAATFRQVTLPRKEIDFGPRKVFVSEWCWNTIYRPTIAAVTPLPQ